MRNLDCKGRWSRTFVVCLGFAYSDDTRLAFVT